MDDKGFTEEERATITRAKAMAAEEFGLDVLGPGEYLDLATPQVEVMDTEAWANHPLTRRLAGWIAEKLVAARDIVTPAALADALTNSSLLPEAIGAEVMKRRGHVEGMAAVLRAIAQQKRGYLTPGKVG